MTVSPYQHVGDKGGLSVLLSRMASIGSARVAGAGLGFLGQILLARWLGPEALGLYFQALSIAAILAIVICFGLPSVAIRFISSYRKSNSFDQLSAFVKGARMCVAVGLGIGVVVSGLAIFLLADRALATALFLGVATAIPLAMMRLNGAFANAFRQFHTAYLPDLLGRPVTIVAIALIVPLVGLQGSPELLLGLHLLAAVVLAGLQLRRTDKAIQDVVACRASSSPEVRDGWKTWISAGLPMIPVALFTAAFADVVIFATAPLLESRELAIFAVCLKIALLAGFGIQLVHQLILPDAADAYNDGRFDDLQARIKQANLLCLVLCLAMTCIFALGGNYLLALFGQEFVAGHVILVVLSLSLVARSVLGPGSQILVLAGQQNAAVKASLIGAGTLLVTAVFAVPAFGMFGASFAVVITTVLWSGVLAWQSAKLTGVSTFGFR
ncbi:MAG: oligosaccharide flippase family protein [Filomicrobium sp.]